MRLIFDVKKVYTCIEKNAANNNFNRKPQVLYKKAEREHMFKIVKTKLGTPIKKQNFKGFFPHSLDGSTADYVFGFKYNSVRITAIWTKICKALDLPEYLWTSPTAG